MKLLRRLNEWACGLTGHDLLLAYEPARLFARCQSCGYESPGWQVERAGTPPKPVIRRRRLRRVVNSDEER